MKNILILILFVFIACESNDNCPKDIKELDICSKYNEAKWELYKLYANCLHENKALQSNFFSNDITFETSDTILNKLEIILFDNKIMRELAEDNICLYYNGIGFEGDQIKTFLRGDFVVLDYDKFDSSLDSIMELVITENKENLTPWLYKQSEMRGIIK